MLTKDRRIEAVKDAIRSPYAWPGGYPVYTIVEDALLCRDCARQEFRSIVQSTKYGYRDGWEAMGATVLWEGLEFCGHCEKELESAYGV